MSGPATHPTVFEATIVPHRSLSPRGVRVLIGTICALTGLLALRFWLLGAWPVAGFAVVEIGVAVFLIRLNARRARATEMILLSEDRMRVIRTDMDGCRTEQTLALAWLHLRLDERSGRVPILTARARDRTEEIGAFLGEEEKRDLAAALAAALERLRNPRFDNPQLRKG